MRRVLFALSAFVFLAVSGDAGAARAETIWSAIVVANNATKPEPTPSELSSFQDTLRELFGYNQFRLIGDARKTLRKGDENWETSSKHFALKVDSTGAVASGYLLKLQLWQDKEMLLETEAKLSKQSPLVIKGPQVGDGQLLLLLVVQ